MSKTTKPHSWLTVDTGLILGTLDRDHLRGGPVGERIFGFEGDDQLRGCAGDDFLNGDLGRDRLWGGDGDDILIGQPLAMPYELRTEVNVMRGGMGDDVYYVHGAGDRVIEKAGAGVDTVRTSIGLTLPDHVENLVAYALGLAGEGPLVGNALDNHIVGPLLDLATLVGLDGNDTLEGGRNGAVLEGGRGDDVLIQSFGSSLGGPGADVFVARGLGAMTFPDTPLRVLDWRPGEGDHIHIADAIAQDSAALLSSGQLRFEADTQRLILDFDPSSSDPLSVDQVIELPGIDHVQASWITVGPLA